MNQNMVRRGFEFIKMAKKKVYYIEDEPFLGKIVKETLENQGFEVLWITDGAKVMGGFQRFEPDVCILDIMLPNVDGYTLCQQIRDRFPKLPVIFLTAKVETADLVKGFEAGGSDYIRKPFSIEELIVRINNQLNLLNRTNQPQTEPSEIIELGKYRFHPRRCELQTPSQLIKLSLRDMQVLSILADKVNRIVDRKTILISVWGDDSFFNSRTLDVYIRKLREYFLEDRGIEIVTMKGKGYLFLIK